MKLSVFCGVSVDGFLARHDDRLDFLHTGEQEPHGFTEFLASVDVIVMGRRTFEVVLKLGHLVLYGKRPVVVLSSRDDWMETVLMFAMVVLVAIRMFAFGSKTCASSVVRHS